MCVNHNLASAVLIPANIIYFLLYDIESTHSCRTFSEIIHHSHQSLPQWGLQTKVHITFLYTNNVRSSCKHKEHRVYIYIHYLTTKQPYCFVFIVKCFSSLMAWFFTLQKDPVDLSSLAFWIISLIIKLIY